MASEKHRLLDTGRPAIGRTKSSKPVVVLKTVGRGVKSILGLQRSDPDEEKVDDCA